MRQQFSFSHENSTCQGVVAGAADGVQQHRLGQGGVLHQTQEVQLPFPVQAVKLQLLCQVMSKLQKIYNLTYLYTYRNESGSHHNL